METVRFFTKVQLIEANREAIASGRNRTLVPEKLEALPDRKFPVVFSLVHNEVEMRCQVVLDEDGVSAVLDVPLETYNNLPSATLHDDGSVDFAELGEVHQTEPSGEMEAVPAFKCLECGEISEEAGDRLYECGDCGTRFTRENSADGMSHRCPDCNTFSSKVADMSCMECEEGEVEVITAYRCPDCGKVHEDEDEARACCGGG